MQIDLTENQIKSLEARVKNKLVDHLIKDAKPFLVVRDNKLMICVAFDSYRKHGESIELKSMIQDCFVAGDFENEQSLATLYHELTRLTTCIMKCEPFDDQSRKTTV